MPKLEMEITQKQMDTIREDVRQELEEDFTHEKLMAYLAKTNSMSMQEYLHKFGLSNRVDGLKDTKVRDLSDHDKMMLACYWLMSGLGHR